VTAPESTTELFVHLGPPGSRSDAAKALATRLGVESFLLFVRDPELGTLVPAPGFPQTFYGGPAWRRLLAQCAVPGRYSGEVDLPPGTSKPALAVVINGMAALLVGGAPIASELQCVEPLLPLLCAALNAEQGAKLALAQASDAKEGVRRAHALATALEQARAEASALNTQLHEEHWRKDTFLAMLAHELRNPLAPVVSSVELLRKGGDAAGMPRVLDIMKRQLSQLSRLIEDLLDVSRVSQGRIELRRRRLRLADVLASAVESSRPVLDARHHEVELSQSAEPLWVDADKVRLTQVFANLVHNAAKYTDPRGRILISAAREGNEAVVRLKDNGVGISPEMLPRIFDLFAQAPVSLSRSQGGLGIGLTLARTLVKLHGGALSAESPGVGQGSTFVVRLLLSAPGEEENRLPPSPELPDAVDPSQPSSLRILVVDDNRDAADSIAEIVRMMGHQPVVAYSGLKAVQVAAEMDADLVFIDIGLPEMDGYEVAARLRRFTAAHAHFVALTGYGTPEDKRRSQDAGFDDHVVKPMSMDVLKAIAARVSANKAAGR
jgi:signal transduction histidine kinase/CheY-like chemotaxis protein